MIDPKDVTIIIPHLGSTKASEYAFDQCLESLLETAPKDIGGPLVVVNGNNGNCQHRLKIPYSMTLLQQGQCKAVNAAVATVNTPWVFITNDDMIYAPGWFEWLQDENYLCISPMLVEPTQGAPTFEKCFCGGAGGDFDKNKFLEYAKEHDRREPPGGLRTGFNLPFLIRKDLWDTIGGYDINYDPWGSNSDSDLEYKIKLAGVQPYQNTNCLVYHFSQTSGTFEPQNAEYWRKNFAYFKEKWGFERTDIGIWEASFEIPGMPERTFWPEWEGKYGH